MKKILVPIIWVICLVLSSCNEDEIEIRGTRDLKKLSLPELKKFLNGTWRFHRAELYTIAGMNEITPPDTVRSYYVFYSQDSLARVDTLIHVNSPPTNVMMREKLMYEWFKLPGFNESAYVLMFAHDGYGYLNKWTADSLVNDTLVFANYFRSEGINKYYFTKEK